MTTDNSNKKIKMSGMSGQFKSIDNLPKDITDVIESHKQFQEKLLRNNVIIGKVNTNPVQVKKFSFDDTEKDK